MKLTLKNPLQAIACRLLAVSIALGAMAASNAAADHVRVFNEKVSGVSAANPVAISPNVLSPGVTAELVEQGADVLENPSGATTKYWNRAEASRTEPGTSTDLILKHNHGARTE